jgi:hypothetical protein
MSKTATLNFTLTVIGDGENGSYVSPPITNTVTPGGAESIVELQVGFNVVTVPPGALMAVIVPASSSANTKTMKGLTGDTGVLISPNLPTLLALPANTASFGLTSAGAEALTIYWL